MYLKKRAISFVSLLFLVSVLLLSAIYLNIVDAAENDDKSYTVSPGVHHQSTRIEMEDGHQALQMLEVDLKDPNVEVIPYTSNNQVYGPEEVGNMITELRNEGKNVVAGTNGDFFSSVGVPGPQITNGEIFTSKRSPDVSMLIFPDDSVRLAKDIKMMATMTNNDGEELEFDMVNRSRVPTHTDRAFLFNYRFSESVKTPEGGLEMIVNVGEDNDQFIAGEAVTGQVDSIEETYDSDINRGTFVISAIGEKADWIEENIMEGEEVEIKVTYNQDVNQAKQVLSGRHMLLKDGEVALDPADFNDEDKHPRTMVAVKEGKLYMVAVDGRQDGHSDGMTLSGAAKYLQSLGMEEAINIDGGGSTTYYARQPGEAQPTLLNSPSDTHERPVGNSLLIVSNTEETDQLAGINVFPLQSVHRVVAGSDLRLTAKGFDESSNKVSVDANEFDWSLENVRGAIDQTGLFTAGEESGKGQVLVSKNGVEQKQEIEVTNDVDRMRISPRNFVIEKNKSQKFSPKVYDSEGNRLTISSHLIDWSVKGDIGEITENGILKTTKAGSGQVRAEYNGVITETNVTVGETPMIENFEDKENIREHEVRTVPGSVELSLVSDPARFGNYSGQLAYDFTGTPGTSGAYVEFLDNNDEVGREITGEPQQFGVWVYGDAKYHRLRLGITDAEGTRSLQNLTSPYGINWTGWQYVYAQVPEDAVHPITLRNIAIEQSNKHNKTAGGLYYDNFHAIYTDDDHHEDIGLLVEDYIESGDIQEQFAEKINSKLLETKNAFNKGSRTKAENNLNDVTELLNTGESQNVVSSDAKVSLTDEIKKILQSDSDMWDFTIEKGEEDSVSIHDLRDAVAEYVSTGDIKGPLQNQLSNTARQAEHHYDAGRMKQANKFMNKFLKQLDKKQMQKHISSEAKETLEINANLVLDSFKDN